jgi:DNA mismatch endonuclease, patch repair protein
MDTVDKLTRSKIMGSVRQKNTGPEIRLRQALHHKGFRYRLNDKRLPGSPDIVLPKYKTVIFVHGCFWHRHNCKKATTPTSRKDFWETKFDANIKRDSRNVQELKKANWHVLVVWECEIKSSNYLERVDEIEIFIKNLRK